jgi:outer membrane protein assembly factor BamB
MTRPFTIHGLQPRTVAAAALALAAALAAAPASATRLVGLTDRNALLTFDSATPTTVSSVSIGNLASRESIVSIDIRNPDGRLYGLSSLGNLYALDASTGTATGFASGVVPAGSSSYEIDWNPQNNNLRVLGSATTPNTNRALTFATGATAIQTSLSRADNGGTLDVVGAAYNNNRLGSVAADLSLYALDAASDALFVNKNAFAGGVLTKVGNLTLGGSLFGISGASGFEIAADGTAYVSLRENLYTVDLTSGALTPLGTIGANQTVIGLTTVGAIPEPATYALMVCGLGAIGWSARRRRGAALLSA